MEGAVDAAVLGSEKGLDKLMEEKFARLLNTEIANLAREG